MDSISEISFEGRGLNRHIALLAGDYRNNMLGLGFRTEMKVGQLIVSLF